jgi:diguanylate cyclase (GGDEF)-like protein
MKQSKLLKRITTIKSVKLAFNLKQRLILSILIACAIPFSFGAVYLNTFFEKWYYAFNQENTQELLAQVDAYLYVALNSQMSNLTQQIAQSKPVLQGDESIRSYSAFETMGIEPVSKIETDISDYMKNLKEAHPEILFVFLGLDDSSYMEYPEFKPSKNYDPRQRPWYVSTMNTQQILMSEPYVSKVTNEKIVSFTKKIILNNGQLGVIGIAVSIEALTERLEEIKIEQEGYVIVVDPYNKVIVSPANHSWLLKTPEEIEEQSILRAINKDGYHFDTLEGEEKLFFSYKKETGGYTIIAVQSPKIYKDNVEQVTFILIGIFTLTFVLIIYVVNYMANRFTVPIITIAHNLENIREDAIDIAIDTEISQYNSYKDEIGTISKAIHVLIKNINKNFDLLIKRNEEITQSNQRLAISEEKLIWQVQQIEENKQFIEHLAMHDSLTNIPNRRYFYNALTHSIASGEKGAVILMDIDDFKGVNDTLGHKVGDDLLVQVANQLKTFVGETSIISRFGGDEFFILVRNMNKHQMSEYLLRMKSMFEQPFLIGEQKIYIKFSIGVSFYPRDSMDVNQLLINADLAMYSIKSSNKNNYAFYENILRDIAIEKNEIADIINEALGSDGFKIVLQPVISSNSGEIKSYEALLRLKNHPIPPSKFIAVAEVTGSIIEIGRRVVELTLSQMSQWKKQGISLKPISINYSAKQLFDHDFYDYLVEKLVEHAIEPSLIAIEMTENVFFEKQDATFIFLNKLRELGIKIMIDDFGTGYASLGYLTSFPIDAVKLDRSINLRYLNHDSIKIIKNIIALIHSFDLEVVAEGIETMEQFELMRLQGCNYIQGYVFSRPLELEDVIPTMGTIYF